jgi:hypothetical protein
VNLAARPTSVVLKHQVHSGPSDQTAESLYLQTSCSPMMHDRSFKERLGAKQDLKGKKAKTETDTKHWCLHGLKTDHPQDRITPRAFGFLDCGCHCRPFLCLCGTVSLHHMCLAAFPGSNLGKGTWPSQQMVPWAWGLTHQCLTGQLSSERDSCSCFCAGSVAHACVEHCTGPYSLPAC